jgi:hypothetical protein
MLKLLLVPAIVFYLLIAKSFFTTWLAVFKQDPDLSSEERFLVLVILSLATVFWPLIIPLAYLELISNSQSTLPELVETKPSTNRFEFRYQLMEEAGAQFSEGDTTRSHAHF